jgi:hypothetical protein
MKKSRSHRVPFFVRDYEGKFGNFCNTEPKFKCFDSDEMFISSPSSQFTIEFFLQLLQAHSTSDV